MTRPVGHVAQMVKWRFFPSWKNSPCHHLGNTPAAVAKVYIEPALAVLTLIVVVLVVVVTATNEQPGRGI